MKKDLGKRLLITLLSALLLGGCMPDALASADKEQKTEKTERTTVSAATETSYVQELFHDQGYIYMTPDEPAQGEEVTLRLRTVRYNVTRAQIQYTTDAGVTWQTADMRFEKKDKTGYYDFWKGTISATGEKLYYRFLVSNQDDANTVFYDAKGVSTQEQEYSRCWLINPGHKTPDWAKGALVYAIMPDAFYNGNTLNDGSISGANTYNLWNTVRKDLFARYGGDIEGVENKLDYLSSLYVDTLYLNPLEKAEQSAGYNAIRYDEVESTKGNEEDLSRLYEAVHKRGMKLINDVVVTFASADSYYFDQNGRWPTLGAYESQGSPFYGMFKFFKWPDRFLSIWSGASLDLNSTAAKKLLYTENDSYFRVLAKVSDGLRFDSALNLWGTTDTDNLKTDVLMKDIRTEMKKENSDLLLIAEADYANLTNSLWDGQWNHHYMLKLKDYAKGLINETLMLQAMDELRTAYPRNVALCSETMMATHDTERVVMDDAYLYNAALLLQMTYIGSPFIYYGEEMNCIKTSQNGIGLPVSFHSIDWNEAQWDMARLNFYKACGELRREYSCLKTGVVNMLGSDVAQNTMTYGRWDKNGAAITVTSQNTDTVTVEIPVRQCDIKDGTILTDWFTGAQYTVKDGKITAAVVPGGTVLVTGKKSSQFRQVFAQTAVGRASKKNRTETKDAASFEVSGKGTVGKKTDRFTFMNTVAYDGFSVFANIRGNGTLMLRDGLQSGDTYYAAMVSGDTLQIQARREKNQPAVTLAKLSCTKNTYVRLERTKENTLCAYTAEAENGRLGAWMPVSDATVSIGMGNPVYYGFAALKGTVRINNLTVTSSGDRATFDTFDGEVDTALFDDADADFVSRADGKLTVTNAKNGQLHHLLTNAPTGDWSFKGMVGASPEKNGYAGIVSLQDEKNYVTVARARTESGAKLFIGKASNGALAMYASVTDPQPEQELLLQLQRVGAYYSAVYSTDNGKTWQYIGKLFTNFSVERVGILVAGKGSTAFDWVSFGDSINDGCSVNTPQTPTTVDVTYNVTEMARTCQYEYLSGDWSMVTGGWAQASREGFAQASVTNKLFYGLRAEATVEVTDGDGWAGLAFGKTTPQTDAADGFVLKYQKDGRLYLTSRGQTLAECSVKAKGGLRLVVEAENGRILVYAGQSPEPVMNLAGTGYGNGYASLCTEGAAAQFCNFRHSDMGASWSFISGSGYGSKAMLSTVCGEYAYQPTTSVAALSGYAFTNFVCTARLSAYIYNPELPMTSGLLLCASEGSSAQDDGAFVHLDENGSLVLSVDGETVDTYVLPSGTVFAHILVIKQNRQYQVFLKGKSDPVLQYTEAFDRGGVLAVYSYNCDGGFSDIAIENLQADQDAQATALVKGWNVRQTGAFSDDFSSAELSGSYLYYNTDSANFASVDGVLRCYGATAWDGGLTVNTGTYRNFTVDFKLRFDDVDGGWMSIGMYKNRPAASHSQTGLSLMLNPSGGVFFYSRKDEDEQKLKTSRISNFKTDAWHDVSIVAQGNRLTAYVDGEQVCSYQNTAFSEGYISITSGMCAFSLDDFRITPNNG